MNLFMNLYRTVITIDALIAADIGASVKLSDSECFSKFKTQHT